MNKESQAYLVTVVDEDTLVWGIYCLASNDNSAQEIFRYMVDIYGIEVDYDLNPITATPCPTLNNYDNWTVKALFMKGSDSWKLNRFIDLDPLDIEDTQLNHLVSVGLAVPQHSDEFDVAPYVFHAEPVAPVESE